MTGSALALGGLAGLAAGVVTGAGAAWAVRSPRSTLLGPVIWRGPATEPSIAFTFDDGPSESTPALLDLLDEHQARATFFVCGANVRRLPAVAREVVRRGHEIANHTMTHEALYLKSRAAIHRQVTEAQKEIADVTGAQPTLFRPPFGCRWPGLAGVLREAELRLVMWTEIGWDWTYPAAKVVARLEPEARAGAIFCLHDGRELSENPDIAATIGAVRVIMPRLGENGFRFPTQSLNASSR